MAEKDKRPTLLHQRRHPKITRAVKDRLRVALIESVVRVQMHQPLTGRQLDATVTRLGKRALMGDDDLAVLRHR